VRERERDRERETVIEMKKESGRERESSLTLPANEKKTFLYIQAKYRRMS
jgi:hypothetical protein